MSSEDTTRQQGMSSGAKIAIGVVILAVIIALLFWLFRGSTTVKQERDKTATETSLHCSASGVDNGIFDTYGAISAEYMIDMIFYDDKIDNLTYNYVGVYDSAEAAKTAGGNIMSAFNLQLYARGLKEDHFGSKTPSFDDTTFRYIVYADNDDITVDSASMLMIDVDKESADQHIPTTYDELKANYQKHGFICKSGA